MPRISLRQRFCTCFIILALNLSVAFSLAAEPVVAGLTVTLQLASGRTFLGEIDGRSNAKTLWLRMNSPGSVLLRPIDWDQINAASQGGKKLTVDELKKLVPAVSKASVYSEPVARAVSLEPPLLPLPMTWQLAGPPPYFDPVVRSLHIEATLANWDADAELDGLVITVSPIAGDGAVLPIYGTLAVELTARLASSHWTTDPPVTIDRWNQVLWPDQIGPLGAYYRLPFSHFRPEDKKAYGPGVTRMFGTLNVRLNVPGHNTVDATTTVRIRP